MSGFITLTRSSNDIRMHRYNLYIVPDEASFDWWMQAGGFDISYPNYDWYGDENGMRKEIAQQNKLILDFGQKHIVVSGNRMTNTAIYFLQLMGN